jgi:hypothetical protein
MRGGNQGGIPSFTSSSHVIVCWSGNCIVGPNRRSFAVRRASVLSSSSKPQPLEVVSTVGWASYGQQREQSPEREHDRKHHVQHDENSESKKDDDNAEEKGYLHTRVFVNTKASVSLIPEAIYLGSMCVCEHEGECDVTMLRRASMKVQSKEVWTSVMHKSRTARCDTFIGSMFYIHTAEVSERSEEQCNNHIAVYKRYSSWWCSYVPLIETSLPQQQERRCRSRAELSLAFGAVSQLQTSSATYFRDGRCSPAHGV